MTARLLFFGSFRDLGPNVEIAPVGMVTLGELRAWLLREEPELSEALRKARAQIAIDGEIVHDDGARIDGAREIAFLPPMSGG